MSRSRELEEVEATLELNQPHTPDEEFISKSQMAAITKVLVGLDLTVKDGVLYDNVYQSPAGLFDEGVSHLYLHRLRYMRTRSKHDAELRPH